MAFGDSTDRDLGLPGRGYGGSPNAKEHWEDRARRKGLMSKLCRFCERGFIRKIESQRFCETRCKLLYQGGQIHEKTFVRWQHKWDGLGCIRSWYEGPSAADEQMYHDTMPRPQHIPYYDFIRRRFYLTIKEIRLRAERSRGADAAKAYRILAEGVLSLWELHGVDLWMDYDDRPDFISWDFSTWQGVPIEKPGMKALEKISDICSQKLGTLTPMKPVPGDLQWLDM